MTPSSIRRPALRRRLAFAAVALLTALVSTSSKTQSRGDCPRFARVPGYGACTNFAGTSCGFCAYRCNDETVVRWNVCSK